VLLCAAAPPGIENDTMSTAIRSEKKEVLLVKWLYI
jgi:hypothetical protein